MIHYLKTRKEYFDEVWLGHKPFEVRVNDRNYLSDDLLILGEGTATSADRAVLARVTCVLHPSDHDGIRSGNVVLGLQILGRIDDDVVMFEHTRKHIRSEEWQSHGLQNRASDTVAEMF